MSSKFSAAVAAAAQTTNMTEAKTGGGDYTPPVEGPCRLRLVGYVELGKHETEYQGTKKVANKVELTFEVSGPKHPPREHDGKKYPTLIVVRENLSLNDKARFFKLFQIMNHAGTARHASQFLGEPFKGRIIHRKYKGKDGKERVAVELFDKGAGAWTIEAPRYEIVDPENGPTGEYAPLKVDSALTPEKCFIWDHADMEQWASIFIDGEYPAEEAKEGQAARPARSKNVLQEKIRSALNFKGSPIYALLLNNGQPVDLTAPVDDEEDEVITQSGASDMADPLAGIGV